MKIKLFTLTLLLISQFVIAAPNFNLYLSTINGEENLPPAVAELLYEEQVLHNKALWGANAFSSDISPEYVPEARPKFPLSYFLIPEENAEFLKSQGHDLAIFKQITTTKNGLIFYKLFIHPESYQHYAFMEGVFEYVGPERTEFMASPTSSYRSLVAWNKNGVEKPFIAKVSLDRNVIGSIDRLVSINEVQRSVANEDAFELLGKEYLRKNGLDYFPESAGLTVKGDFPNAPDKLGGQLIREIPASVISGELRWLSFSALMSPNKTNGLLVFDIIRASGMTSEQFINTVLIDAYMKMFEEISLKKGMNFEPHSQNLCFEVDANLKVTGNFVIRDFGGVWPDMMTMMENNGPIDAYLSEGNAAKYKFYGGHSNALNSYAFFYKRQVFDLLVSQMARFDRSLTQFKINQLMKTIDTKMAKLVAEYLIPTIEMTPTMQNKNSLIKTRNAYTPLPNVENAVEIPATGAIWDFMREKSYAGEWVEVNDKPIEKFILAPKGIIAVDVNYFVVAFGIYTPTEAKNFEIYGENPEQFLLKARAPILTNGCLPGLRGLLR